MSQFADIRVEWRVADIERGLHRKAESHELHSLRSDVDRLEHSLREAGAEIAGLRSERYELQARVEQLENAIFELQSAQRQEAQQPNGDGK